MEEETKEVHPSYGQLEISRCSSNKRVPLYGTSNQCHETIRLTINKSEIRRNLSRFWYYASEPIIEVEMSPAQFAEAITSLNRGGGTPVTITKYNQKRIPEPPHTDERDLFDKEFAETVKDTMTITDELIEEADSILNQKTVSKASLKELRCKLEAIQREVKSNMPFMAQSFNEHLNKSVSSAKIELDSFIDSKIRAAGISALTREKAPALNISDRPEKE